MSLKWSRWHERLAIVIIFQFYTDLLLCNISLNPDEVYAYIKSRVEISCHEGCRRGDYLLDTGYELQVASRYFSAYFLGSKTC